MSSNYPPDVSGCEPETVGDERAGVESLTCDYCDNPPTCVGAYEDPASIGLACDDCCGHGCEDGTCRPIDELSDELSALGSHIEDLNNQLLASEEQLAQASADLAKEHARVVRELAQTFVNDRDGLFYTTKLEQLAQAIEKGAR